MSTDTNANPDPLSTSTTEELASELTSANVSAVEAAAIQEVLEDKEQEIELAELERRLLDEFGAETRKRFDESLDTEQEIEVAGATFYPSRVLFTLDPDLYEDALGQFKQLEEDEIRDLVYEEYPKPIALHLHRALDNTRETKSRFESLRDTWEATIYIVFALVLGEFRANQYPLRLTKTQKKERQTAKPHKQMLLENICTWKLAEKLDVIEQLYDYATLKRYTLNCLRIISPNLIQRISDLNRFRNEFAHNESSSESQAREQLDRYVGDVLNILRLASDLKDVRLLRYRRGTANYNQHVFEVYTGWHIDSEDKSLDTSKLRIPGSSHVFHSKNILAMHDDSIYLISPWYTYVEEDAGHTTRLCYYKQLEGLQIAYTVLGQGKSEMRQKNDFSSDLAELDNLLQLGDKTP